MNVIIRGFKAAGKLIGRGYSVITGGTYVKICRVINEPFIKQKLTSKEFLSQRLSAEPFILKKLSTES